MVFKTGNGRESFSGCFFDAGYLFGLLDTAQIQGRLSADMVGRHFDVFEYVLLQNEHGKGSATDDCNHGYWNPSAFSA